MIPGFLGNSVNVYRLNLMAVAVVPPIGCFEQRQFLHSTRWRWLQMGEPRSSLTGNTRCSANLEQTQNSEASKMKKFLVCMFAGMLFVPTLSGCGESTEATINEDTGTAVSDGGEMTEESYEDAMKKGMEEEAPE
jgi:hypothetical protein